MSTSNRRRTVDLIDRRVGIIFGMLVVLLVIAGARALYLGTFRSGALIAAAAAEHIQVENLPAPRGEITDRSGTVLAISEAADEVIADPMLVSQHHPLNAANALSKLLKIKSSVLYQELTRADSRYVVLSANTPAATAARVEALGIDGINLQPIEARYYPFKDEASQVLGWLQADGSGASGLEYLFNRTLAGQNGSRNIINDAMGKAIAVHTTKTMVPGKSLQLTISAPLQSYVEKMLASAAAEYHPEGATAIVTDPRTDQILALANWPTMNSNDVTAADLSSQDGHDPADMDQAVALDYEPGSTFKAVTVSGALQDGLITPNTVFDVPPYLEAYGKKVTDAEVHGYEDMTTAGILKVSSNIGADLIGRKLGPTRFSDWVTRFGFGKTTGVALPGEEQGIIVKPNSPEWNGLSMLNMPFGQGEDVTPMQMVQAYDAIADGGILRTPQLIESIGGKKVAEPQGHRIISANVASEVRVMLRGVLADGGTASGAGIPGYDMAGKTGTAQVAVNGKYSNTLYNGSFIGMVPASDPKLVVAVILNGVSNGVGFGGTVAAPTFQKIVGWAVPHFGINPCPVNVPSICNASADAQ